MILFFNTSRVFDRDGNGYITRDELQVAMDMIGETVTEAQLSEMLAIADLDKDGKINYEGINIICVTLQNVYILIFFIYFRICPSTTLKLWRSDLKKKTYPHVIYVQNYKFYCK